MGENTDSTFSPVTEGKLVYSKKPLGRGGEGSGTAVRHAALPGAGRSRELLWPPGLRTGGAFQELHRFALGVLPDWSCGLWLRAPANLEHLRWGRSRT